MVGSVGPTGRGFIPRGAWTSAGGTTYAVDDIVTYGGNTFRVKVAHTPSAGSPPADGATYELWAAAGATGGAHAASHVSGADQIATATTTARGLMDTTQVTKLNGIEASATNDMTALEIRSALVTVDGAGSGIDADLLDGTDIADVQL
ncbi:MAG: carbohydrate-binding protein, partial [Rubrobacteraceae bacterium]